MYLTKFLKPFFDYISKFYKNKMYMQFFKEQIITIVYYFVVLTICRYIVVYKHSIEKYEYAQISHVALFSYLLLGKIVDIYRFTFGNIIDFINVNTIFRIRDHIKNRDYKFIAQLIENIMYRILYINSYVFIFCMVSIKLIQITKIYCFTNQEIYALFILFISQSLLLIVSALRNINDTYSKIPVSALSSFMQLSAPLIYYLIKIKIFKTSVVYYDFVISNLIGSIVGLFCHYITAFFLYKRFLWPQKNDSHSGIGDYLKLTPAYLMQNIIRFGYVELLYSITVKLSKIFYIKVYPVSDFLATTLKYDIYKTIIGTYDSPMSVANKISAPKANNPIVLLDVYFFTNYFVTVIFAIVFTLMIKYQIYGSIFFTLDGVGKNIYYVYMLCVPTYSSARVLECFNVVNGRVRAFTINQFMIEIVSLITFFICYFNIDSFLYTVAVAAISRNITFYICSLATAKYYDRKIISVKKEIIKFIFIFLSYIGCMYLFS